MNKAQLTTYIGTVIGLLLAGAAAKYPQYAAAMYSVATLLFGWLHLPQPGSAKLPPSLQ